MFQLSQTSKNRLQTCHPDIQVVIQRAIKVTVIDFGIAFGHRTIEEQQSLYAQGRTQPGNIVTYVDGINKLSKHNHSPSLAVDIYPYYEGKAQWNDLKAYHYLAGLILGIASERDIKLEWGGFWSTWKDMPHFQI